MRKSYPVSLVGRRLKIEDHMGNGHVLRSLFMKALIMRIGKKRNLIDRGVIETGLTTTSLSTTARSGNEGIRGEVYLDSLSYEWRRSKNDGMGDARQ